MPKPITVYHLLITDSEGEQDRETFENLTKEDAERLFNKLVDELNQGKKFIVLDAPAREENNSYYARDKVKKCIKEDNILEFEIIEEEIGGDE